MSNHQTKSVPAGLPGNTVCVIGLLRYFGFSFMFKLEIMKLAEQYLQNRWEA